MPFVGEVLDADDALVPSGAGAGVGVAEAMVRGEVDIQIRTAKAYPRDVTTFLKKLETLTTRDVEVAESCTYKLKRRDSNEKGGFKIIEGPSIRFAEILVACWGHMRIAGMTAAEDDRFVTLRGMAWDLETNSAFAVDVKRRITTREGRTYSDDMIGVTSNAGVSVATRNAILHVIPRAFWNPVYEKCKAVARGDEKTLQKRRAAAFEWFLAKYKKTPADLYALLGIRSEADFTLEHLDDLNGLKTALVDGDTTIEEAFADVRGDASLDPKTQIASDLGCSEAEAAAVLLGFETLNYTPAQRTVTVKKHKGQVGELLQWLRDMSGQPLPVATAVESAPASESSESTRKDGERTASSSAGGAAETPASQTPATSTPTATTSRGRFSF